MRILIIGAGGVGGYFGARLVEAGGEVTFLVRPHRADPLAETGLRLESPLGNWAGKIRTVTADRLSTPFDLVVLACKAYHLSAVMSDIRPAVTSETSILPFLNGIAHLDLLAKAFPEAHLWGGVAHLGVCVAPDGTIRHLNALDTFLFGPLSPSAAGFARAAALESCFDRVAITARAERNIRQAMWDKLVFLATFAGATCTMRADIGAIVTTQFGARMIKALLGECCAIASAEGFAPSEAEMAGYREQLYDISSRATASMLRDIRAGGRTEGAHVLGDLVSSAHRHSIAAPILELCLTHLQSYEIIREREVDDRAPGK